jgi:hypothetical protein
MKTVILAALIILGLGAGVANAQTVKNAPQPQNGAQYDWTVGGAGWG